MKAREIPVLSPKECLQLITRINFFTNDNCWNWEGVVDKGYGQISIKGNYYRVHRVAYQFFTKKKVSDDLALDHLCMNKICVNPKHLEVVTVGENTRRYNISIQQPDCKNGHPLSGDNLYICSRGWRNCRKCRANNQAKINARRYLKNK